MAKHIAKHKAKRGQIKKSRHQARKSTRKEKLFETREGEPNEFLQEESPDKLRDEVPIQEESPDHVREEAPAQIREEEPTQDREESPAAPESGIKGLTYDEVFGSAEDVKNIEEEKHARRMGKAWKVFLGLVITTLVLTGAYILLDRYVMCPDRFQAGSTINGINVAGLGESQARDKIEKELNSKVLTLYQGGKRIGNIRGFSFRYGFGDKVKKCLYPGYPLKFTRLFDKKKRGYKIDILPTNKDKAFEDQYKALDIVKHAKGTEVSKDAYVDLSNHDFNVVPEVYGNYLDIGKLREALLASIGANQMQFSYEPGDYYVKPEILSTSQQIRDSLAYCRKYLAQTVTLNTFKGPYTISPKDMNGFLKVKEDGTRVIRKKKLKKFVTKLRENFTVSGGTRHLNLVGGKITVSGGNYGVAVDAVAEYKQLKKDFATSEDVSRDMIYENGHSPADLNDIGNTYVEVDISRQTLWCVVDGKTVVKSDVVTGNVAEGHATPTGVYYIAYKVSPATLRGENADGSKYESKVTYWMPFNGGIGFHDATWRGSFGGTIYQYSGSHGCVNMPYSKAEELYYQVDAGMPVVVHD